MKPVAWMNSKGDIILPASQANKEYNIPLYTAPRELSDEEIEVLKEIIRISDRKHPLWDKAKEFLK